MAASTAFVRKFADAAGTGIDEAARLIDDIGEGNARRMLDGSESAEDAGGSLFGGPNRRTGLALAGAGGATAVGWQGLGAVDSRASAREAQAQADQADTTSSYYEQLMNSGLSPEQMSQFGEMYDGSTPGNDPNGGGEGFLSSLSDWQKIALLIAVAAIIYSMQSSSGAVPMPSVFAGGRR